MNLHAEVADLDQRIAAGRAALADLDQTLAAAEGDPAGVKDWRAVAAARERRTAEAAALARLEDARRAYDAPLHAERVAALRSVRSALHCLRSWTRRSNATAPPLRTRSGPCSPQHSPTAIGYRPPCWRSTPPG